jgi:hypothetical protein
MGGYILSPCIFIATYGFLMSIVPRSLKCRCEYNAFDDIGGDHCVAAA